MWGFSVWAHNLLTCAEIEKYADAFAKEAQAKGGTVPKGVWKRISEGRNLTDADKSAIRAHILANPVKYPNVNIKPRGVTKYGPHGKPSTRTLDLDIANDLKGKGWKLENGAGSGKKQEWIKGSGPGRKGGTAVDVTASRMVNGKKEWVRVQTVSTLAHGKTLNPDELAAAARIRAKFPNDKLILVPKGSPPSVWQAHLAGL